MDHPVAMDPPVAVIRRRPRVICDFLARKV